MRVLGGTILVEVSVEAKLVPSNHDGTVADGPVTVSPESGDEEAESLDENPNLIVQEGVVRLKFVKENGEEAFCLPYCLLILTLMLLVYLTFCPRERKG